MKFLLRIVFTILAGGPFMLTALAQYPYQDTSLPFDDRVNDLVSRMTISEKISQLGHKSSAVSRLGIASYNYWNEGIHGVARSGLATSFPVSIALSATWNPELVYRVATATSDEARVMNNKSSKGLTYWCPTINMARDPRWGRSEENYGEDVYLTSKIAVAFIKGMQGNDPKYLKTVATAKHFAANNVEKNRYGISSNMDERNLREYYTPAFKACVTDGKVYSVMSSYNAVNGVPSSANRTLLTNMLRQEWGFQGYVVSDCDAVGNVWDSHAYVATAPEATAICVRNGDDLNCGTTFPDNALKAIDNGLLSEQAIDVAVKRVLKARFLLGEFDPVASVPYKSIPASRLDCQEHRDLALEAAREAIVLLKNEKSFLPLNKDSVKTIAVIGPNAQTVQLGGYSGTPSVSVSTLQGIADVFGFDISNGIIEAENFTTQSGIQTESCNEGGSNVGYINNGDYVAYDSINFGSGKQKFDIRIASATSGGNLELVLDNQTGQSIGNYTIPATGSWQVWKTLTFDLPGVTGFHKVFLKFTGGSGYLFNINWLRFYNLSDVDPTAGDGPIRYAKGCDVTGALVQSEVNQAVSFAKSSDVAVVVLGTDLNVSDESADRSNITLPGNQEQLLKAIYRANPKTVLVLINCAEIAINWAQDSIPSILSAWYDGQSQGTAISDVLFGKYNPKGKTTTTWYRSISDLPLMSDYNIRNNRTYMYFKGTPLYPFGYGLSYTTFGYSNLKTDKSNLALGDSVVVTADITNTGARAGTEIVQLYVHADSNIDRPMKELKGFANVTLEPGETKTVTFILKHNDLSYYDENDKAFLVESGQLDILVGASSADIRLSGQMAVSGGTVASTYRQNPYRRIEAENFENNSKGVKPNVCSAGGLSVESLNNGSYLVFKNLDFTAGAKQFSVALASMANEAVLEIVLDSISGESAGKLTVTPTGSLSDYKIQTCELTTVTGIRDVYLVVKTTATNSVKIDWICFQKTVGEDPSSHINQRTGYSANIFPNPAKKEIGVNYQLGEASKVRFEVFTPQGSLVTSIEKGIQKSGSYQEKLIGSGLAFRAGVYIVRFSTESYTKSMRVEVTK